MTMTDDHKPNDPALCPRCTLRRNLAAAIADFADDAPFAFLEGLLDAVGRVRAARRSDGSAEEAANALLDVIDGIHELAGMEEQD